MLKKDDGSDKTNRVTALIAAFVGVFTLISMQVVAPFMGLYNQTRDDHAEIILVKARQEKLEEWFVKMASIQDGEVTRSIETDQNIKHLIQATEQARDQWKPIKDWINESPGGPKGK